MANDVVTAPDPGVRPKYYTSLVPEPIDVIEKWNLGFHVGTILTYLVRYQEKGNRLLDLKKARFYLERLIRIEEESLFSGKPPAPDTAPVTETR